MPTWFLFAIAAPAIWAAINHIDKYVVSRYAENKKPEALVVFACLISGATSLLIYCFADVEHISISQAILIMFAGVLFVAGYIPYIYALKEDEVSIVAPLYQMILPFSYILGVIFLHESLSGKQMFAGFLVLLGAVILTLNFDRLAWKGRIFRFMVFSCILIAFNTLIFKVIGLESSFWTASFWEYIGAFIFGLIILAIPVYRNDFKSFVYEGGRKIVLLNILSELLNVFGRMFFNFAALLAPIALVYVVSGTQPFFIFLYGLIIFIFIPKIKPENFSRRHIIFKLGAIVIIILGSALLFL